MERMSLGVASRRVETGESIYGRGVEEEELSLDGMDISPPRTPSAIRTPPSFDEEIQVEGVEGGGGEGGELEINGALLAMLQEPTTSSRPLLPFLTTPKEAPTTKMSTPSPSSGALILYRPMQRPGVPVKDEPIEGASQIHGQSSVRTPLYDEEAEDESMQMDIG